MKKFIVLLVAFFLFGDIFLPLNIIAQAPQRMSYQAVIRNAQNNLVINTQVSIRISILQGTEDGSAVYIETQTPTTNPNGLISIEIGTGNTIDDFSVIEWKNGPYFIKTETDPSGGTNYTITHISQLLSVPYSIYSNSTGELKGNISGSQITDLMDFIPEETDPVFGSSLAVDISEEDTTRWGQVPQYSIADILNTGNAANGKGVVSLGPTSINVIGAAPSTQAILDISSSTMGVLLPRMNRLEIEQITNPEAGLIVMDTTGGIFNLLIYNGNEWSKLVNTSSPDYGLILWNELGSEEEISESKIGPGGEIIGTSYAFEPAKSGNGYVRKATGDNYVKFPGSILQNLKKRGTVELWINPKVSNPVPYSYGVFPLFGNTFGTNSHVYIAWGDGVSGTGFYGSVNFDGTGHSTPFEATQFVATPGTPFHVAICWDIDGIEGSTNTIRLFRNGELIGTSDATWDPDNTTVTYDGFALGMGPDGNGYDKYIVDNLKVWNHARVTFAEVQSTTILAGDLEVQGIIKGDIEVDKVHVSQITGLLGQGFTMNFPDIIDNLASFEIPSIMTFNDKVVVISGPGTETERISTPTYYNPTREMQYYKEYPGVTMEYPFIFEVSNPTDVSNLKAWFDNPSASEADAALIIRNLAGTETCRWAFHNYVPDGYEPGNDGRTRFTIKHNGYPDNINGCEFIGSFGSLHSYNPETDTRVDIESFDTGDRFSPQVDWDMENRTITLTYDFQEGYQIYNWVKATIAGTDPNRAFSVIQTTDGITEISRRNYFEAIPIKYEHFYGFGQDSKLKARIVIAYGYWEDA